MTLDNEGSRFDTENEANVGIFMSEQFINEFDKGGKMRQLGKEVENKERGGVPW